MTIIEALKSGKRIRRKQIGHQFVEYRPDRHFSLDRDDILADDWEVEPDPKPRMLAWVCNLVHPIDMDYGQIRLLPDDHKFDSTYMTRCPWLDEPDSGMNGGT